MPNFFGVPVSRMAVLKKRKLRRADTLEAPENVELPEITGVFAPDEVLTVSNGTWLNDPTSFAYQWYVNDVLIDGATENTFTVTETDGETEVKADVTASNAGGDTTATSDPVALVFNITPASISGTNTIGQTLTGTPGMWSGSPTLTYQWRRNGTNISGQTGSTYLLVDADFGATIDWLEIPNGDTEAAVASAATGAVTVPYLWRDDYTAAVAAPMAGTRTNTPGPGSTVIVDADNELSVHATNKLVFAGSSPAYGNPQIRTNDSYARQAGRAAFFKLLLPTQAARDNGTISLGWSSSTGFSFNSLHTYINSSRANGMNTAFAAAKQLVWAFDVDYVLGVIHRANGAHYVARGGAYGDWIRAAVTRDSTVTPLYAGRQWGASNGQPDHTKAFYGSDLGGPWATDSDYDHLDDTPTANDTATGSADGLQYIRWTCGTGETLSVMFRRTDDNNCMVLRCAEATDTMKIIKIEGGVETELSSVAQTFNNATVYRIGLRYVGGEVRSWAADGGAVKNDITGATFNLAMTGVKVAGFATAANWEVWPYWITGAANTQLDMHAPSL